jgi:hypothetical protein
MNRNRITLVDPKLNRRFKLTCRSRTRSILEIAGLSQFFLVFPHVDAALAAT